jgi:hypothetical protein
MHPVGDACRVAYNSAPCLDRRVDFYAASAVPFLVDPQYIDTAAAYIPQYSGTADCGIFHKTGSILELGEWQSENDINELGLERIDKGVSRRKLGKDVGLPLERAAADRHPISGRILHLRSQTVTRHGACAWIKPPCQAG